MVSPQSAIGIFKQRMTTCCSTDMPYSSGVPKVSCPASVSVGTNKALAPDPYKLEAELWSGMKQMGLIGGYGILRQFEDDLAPADTSAISNRFG